MRNQFDTLDETPQDDDDFDTRKSRTTHNGSKSFVDQKGRYKGDIDPVTKLRNGNGVYTYTNPFFQY